MIPSINAYLAVAKKQNEKSLEERSLADERFLNALDNATSKKKLWMIAESIIENPHASTKVLFTICDKIVGNPKETSIYCDLAKSKKLNKELEDMLLNLKISNSFKVDECLAANPSFSEDGKNILLERYSSSAYKLRKLKYAMMNHAVMKRKTNQ